MRLKTYLCNSMEDALATIRKELGPDAVIISTLNEGKKVRVTAACEKAETVPEIKTPENKFTSEQVYNYLSRMFAYHGVPQDLQERLLQAIVSLPKTTLEKGPVTVFENLYSFNKNPLLLNQGGVVMLAGPAGAGKTITLTKLAAEYAIAQKPVHLVTTDSQKAGACEQLLKLSGALKVKADVVQNAGDLLKLIEQSPQGHAILVDTPGINPFLKEDTQMLADYIFAVKQAPILVFPAGGDPLEVIDQVNAFKELGVTRFITTRLDTVRRMGSLLVALFENQLELFALSAGPTLAHRLIASQGEKVINLLQKTIPKAVLAAPNNFVAESPSIQKDGPSPKQPLPWVQLLQEKRL